MQGFLGSVEGHADFVAGDADEIAGIKVVDDLTIELTLSQPDVTIPGVLAIPPFYVLPAEEVQAEGEDFQFTMGTGPWKLEELDQAQRRLSLLPLRGLRLRRISCPTSTVWSGSGASRPTLEAQRVQRGELEAMGANVPAATVLQLQQGGAGEDTLQLWDSLSIVWYEFDVTQPPFDNPLVRHAVNHAFNRERLQRLLIQPTGHFYPTALLGYDPEATVYAYDPERAKALLDEAGVSGLAITIPIWGEDQGESQQLLQQDLAAVGITVTLEQDPADENEYRGRVARDVSGLAARLGDGPARSGRALQQHDEDGRSVQLRRVQQRGGRPPRRRGAADDRSRRARRTLRRRPNRSCSTTPRTSSSASASGAR